MGYITLEFDNTLEKSSIIMPLISSSQYEGGEDYSNNYTDKMQTSVFGIQTPLIMINSIVIDFDAIHYFSLSSTGELPELSMVVEDRYELINNIDKPGMDNEVRIQIIPRFDNAYKKINLTFFISNINVEGKEISLNCSYKLPKLTSSNFKTFGKTNTYSLFKNIALDTQLGFATNISELNDNRYVYCDNKSYLNLMHSEITNSDSNTHILDWWIDLWDNLNLVDIKERYEVIESNEDMMIWVAGQVNEVTENEVQPVQVPATLTNLPMQNNSELFVKSYSIESSPGSSLFEGTDKVYSVYNMNSKEHFDYFVQDGDIKQDIFTRYEYIGENYGEYNYLLSSKLRSTFLQKLNSETIVITLQSPLLGLMRGHKVNFIRYVNDDKIENKMNILEKAGVITRSVESNIPLDEFELKDDINNDGMFRIDKTVSGQYLIIGVNITYSNNNWDYNLTLAKPASSKVSILNKDE